MSPSRFVVVHQPYETAGRQWVVEDTATGLEWRLPNESTALSFKAWKEDQTND